LATYGILVINPGSTSTKLAIFSEEGMVLGETIDHSHDKWIKTCKTLEQLAFRIEAVETFLRKHGITPNKFSCVVARGGLLRPLSSGTYLVNEAMLSDLRSEIGGSHASNLGGLIAWHIASRGKIPAYIVDPVSVDEFSDEARFSGLPQVPRRSLLHALNMKKTARKAAAQLGRPLENLFLIIAHLGSGFSISPCYGGKLTDVNNSNEEGPFTVERAGTLPCVYLKELCEATDDLEELKRELTQRSGMFSYLGTKDARKVENRAKIDRFADRVFRAMAYQVAKEMVAMAAAYPENPDAVVITGGLAYSKYFTGLVTEYTSFLGCHLIYPGEDEIEALAHGALRVVKGEELPRSYPEQKVVAE